MRKYYPLLLIALLLALAPSLSAQQVTVGSKHSIIKPGINIGGAWQCSDVRRIPGWGAGLTLEVPLIENDKSLLGLAIRGRWLYSATYGQDWQTSDFPASNPAVNGTINPNVDYTGLGYYYANHRTRSHDLGGELMITANRLRARTGWLLYIWGGLGAVNYRVDTDHYDDFFGTSYDYSNGIGGVNGTTRREILDDIYFLRDGEYETPAFDTQRPRWVFAPSVGIGWGYQFTPGFAIALEHKVTFPFSDAFDGEQWNERRRGNDIHHYTALGFHFGIGGGTGRPSSNNTADNFTSGARPVISLTNPPSTDYNAGNDCRQQIRARIRNVAGKAQITFVHDGVVINPAMYDYNARTDIFEAWVDLRTGANNQFEIRARNSQGTAVKRFTVRCGRQVQGGSRPVINLESPPGGNYSGVNCEVLVRARIQNVNRKSELTVMTQGRVTVPPSQYNFDPASKLFSMRLTLTPGRQQQLEIIAKNNFGEARRTLTATCTGIQQNFDPRISICHIPPGDPTLAHTISIRQSEWSIHRSHGDIRGACAQETMLVCWQGNAIRVSISAWPRLQQMGALQGPCPVEQITICHVPPANPNNPITVVIPANQWPTHQSHGDVMGPCSGRTITICHTDPRNPSRKITMVVPEESWPIHSAHGDTRGACPNVKMTICHIPPANPNYPQTLQIDPVYWNQHQAHGDVQGPCDMTQFTICHNDQPMVIPAASWPYYQAHGAIQGDCPQELITICHIPPSNPDNPQTIQIDANLWAAHAGHGDVQGSCNMTRIKICYNGKEKLIPTASWPFYSAQGAIKGNCPVAKMTICHIPPSNPNNPQTLQINPKEWALHQSHGDMQGSCPTGNKIICLNGKTQTVPVASWTYYANLGATEGKCPEDKVTICHVPPSHPDNPQTLTIPVSQLASHTAHGDVKGRCNMTPMTICYQNHEISIPTASWNWYKGKGASKGKCPEETITICHIPPADPTKPVTLEIKESQLSAHLSHGDTKGTCNLRPMNICYESAQMSIPTASWPHFQNLGAIQGDCPAVMITICHIPPTNPGKPETISIPETAWPAHAAHGDTKGRCNMSPMVICLEGSEVSIPTASWPSYQSQGAIKGKCPEDKITICHIPPGSPNSPQTIQVLASEWPAHRAHGDSQGACNNTPKQICLEGQNMTVPTASWAYYANLGATNGKCPEVKITICHIPADNPSRPQTIQIPESQWSTHRAHGDIKGACNMSNTQVCFNGQTTNIPQASFAYYLGQGAEEGPCPEPEMTICYINPEDPSNPQTMTIKESEWPSWRSRGATKGACATGTKTVCYNDETITIPNASWSFYQSQGAVEGECQVKMIQVCIFPPGNPNNPITATIPQDQWPAAQAQGATRGPCDMTPMTICHRPTHHPENYQTLVIPRAAWKAHKAHGDTEGECPKITNIRICHFPPGDIDNPQTIDIPPSEWAAHEAHGDVRGDCDMTVITICHQGQTLTTREASWKFHKNHGDTKGNCPEPQISICHVPPGNPNNPQTIQIPQSAWSAHQGHGDTQGACPGGTRNICYNGQTMSIPNGSWNYYQTQGAESGVCPEAQITICHIPPGNPQNPQTIQIPQSALSTHQSHGDIQGPCPTGNRTICFNNQTMTVPNASWNYFQSQGAQNGACPEPKITICHIPPGNPNNPQTLQIPQSAWAAHQGHGDTQGACASGNRTICYNNQTMTVPNASWNYYQSKGAKNGKCPEPKITICHIPPGNPNNPQTLQIPQSAWSAHQSHGDVKGACASGNRTICFNGNTMTVPNASWNYYRGQGAKNGACPKNNTNDKPSGGGGANGSKGSTINSKTSKGKTTTAEKEITICVSNARTRQKTTMKIKESEWPTYQKQGATKGPCSSGTKGGR